MAAPAARAAQMFAGRRTVPYAFYRSGTSRGLFLLERDVPPRGPARDELLCRLMGSGHPLQLEGFGGGGGPTSKAVIVGPHSEPGSVTYTFVQCHVEEAVVDHSHGDCGNMIGAVGPFALEAGLLKLDAAADATHVRIHSLSTGSIYSAEVLTEPCEGGRRVRYDGDLLMPGVPRAAAPVMISTLGVAGAQTGRLLPTGRAVDRFDLGKGLGDVNVTVVDFARALVMLDAREVLPHFGYESIQEVTWRRVLGDVALNEALDRVRHAASQAIGMGDCTGKDAPKVALLAPASGADGPGAGLACRYWVNPERRELHPTLAMTAAQAVAAACFLGEGVARAALPAALRPAPREGRCSVSVGLAHPKGLLPVTVTAPAAPEESFPEGRPDAACYALTVRPIAEGRAIV